MNLPLALLSAGALLFEIGLTRLFSVAQFYHFAFMLVSLALLGFGVGGTLLASAPGLVHWIARRERLAWLAAGFALTTPGSYAVLNFLPFDSFRIAWEIKQVGLLALNFLALAVPFSLVGLAVGALLAARPEQSHQLYGASLIGSAVGAGLALLVPGWFGGEGVVLGAAWLGALAAVLISDFGWFGGAHHRFRISDYPQSVVPLVLLVALTAGLLSPPNWLSLRLSPFKPLSQMRAAPDAVVTVSRWSGAARVDVLESSSVRLLPGISFAYPDAPPPQAGMFVDGDAPTPISRIDLADPETTAFAGHLSQAAAFVLRPGADVLIVEPGGGLDVAAALALGARSVTVTYREPLLPDLLVGEFADFSGGLYADPRVTVVPEDSRAFLQRTRQHYDVILLALTDPNRPITSGAYSLTESHTLTVEAIRASLQRLAPDGVFALSRWLQSPPSETLRAYGLLLAALEQEAPDVAAERQVAGLRGFQHATFLVQPGGFGAADWTTVRALARDRRFDLIAGPHLAPADLNRYSVLPEPVYHQALQALRTAPDRDAFYAEYEFDVRPPTDDRPYFFHFFKWRQTQAVLATLGQTWLPFGGSGYFVLILLLALAVLLGAGLVVIPVVVNRLRTNSPSPDAQSQLATETDGPARLGTRQRPGGGALVYFASLGLGFLLVEIPLAQRYILFLGRPVYALAVVVGGVLAFSGLGSLTARRWRLRWALGLLCGLIVLYPPGLSLLFDLALRLPLGGRVVVALLSLAPLGLLLGVPFAAGLARLEEQAAHLIPWAWAINGSTSVISAVLAPLLSLSFGFRVVLWTGALAYLGALSVVLVNGTKRTSRIR